MRNNLSGVHPETPAQSRRAQNEIRDRRSGDPPNFYPANIHQEFSLNVLRRSHLIQSSFLGSLYLVPVSKAIRINIEIRELLRVCVYSCVLLRLNRRVSIIEQKRAKSVDVTLLK
ncbi:MAG: hypothetical protein AUF79_18550 [Crenarchaeota archaeon 13_1_20CM_2_51_8]|nr:MAG: hypothetical protein AUF79_18550 [Crenarchaeota archaeon 13_1_20CM_2_51_8]